MVIEIRAFIRTATHNKISGHVFELHTPVLELGLRGATHALRVLSSTPDHFAVSWDNLSPEERTARVFNRQSPPRSLLTACRKALQVRIRELERRVQHASASESNG